LAGLQVEAAGDVDGDGIIRAGNGVYEQAKALGLTVREVEAAPDELIAVVRPDLHGDAAIRAAILDNAAGETSTWDMEALRQLHVDMPNLLAGLDEVQAQFDAAIDILPFDEAFGALPEGDRAPFQQMTFTLSDAQADTVKRALDAAKDAGAFVHTGNENSNGNALARLAEAYLGES
jgi:hypothetical protein